MKRIISLIKHLYTILWVKLKLGQRKLTKVINISFLFVSIASLGFIIYEFGYLGLSPGTKILKQVYIVLLVLYFLRFIYQNLIANKLNSLKKYVLILRVTTMALLSIILINYFVLELLFKKTIPVFSITRYPIWIYIFIAYLSIREISVFFVNFLSKTLKPSQLFVFSFLIIISIGSGLLMLPKATYSGINFLDAIFISTSSVCITGLTPIDIGTSFTPMGHIIILCLIQVGGLGIMTFTSFLGAFFLGKTSYESQIVMKGLFNENNYNSIFTTLRNIILTTLGIELIGTFLIYYSIDGNSLHDLFFSIFHSVSAFCNAGISTLPGNFHDTSIRDNYSLYFWVATLVVVGGLGFPIIFNYSRYIIVKLKNAFFRLLKKYHRIKYFPRLININTKLVLLMTVILLVGGTIMFFITEYNNTFSGMNFGEKLLNSYFFSASTRTAGFNNVDISQILPTTALILILFMWIGASPNSTGGGIKTTTFALAILNVVQIIRGKDRTEIWNRKVSNFSMLNAFSIVFLSICFMGVFTFIISLLEPQVPFLRVLFEVVSATGTVGFSTGLMPTFSAVSKAIFIVIMFTGRIGMLTILISVFKQQYIMKNYSYPEDNILLI